MAFDQSSILDAWEVRSGADLLVRWNSSAPAGTVFQVYLDRKLVWHGTQRRLVLPYPKDGAANGLPIDIGAVLTTEATTDFSASLPALGYDNRANLQWYGGTYLDPTIVGFHIYSSPSPGAPVSYTAPIDQVTAYPQNNILDGAGYGPAGYGAAGMAASTYTWRSAPLAAGVWTFGVKPYNASGNEGTTTEVTYTATAPPNPPAPFADGTRLQVQSYNSGTRQAVLAWNASPP